MAVGFSCTQGFARFIVLELPLVQVFGYDYLLQWLHWWDLQRLKIPADFISYLKFAQGWGRTWYLLVVVYFLSQQQHLGPLGYCAPQLHLLANKSQPFQNIWCTHTFLNVSQEKIKTWNNGPITTY